jgi:hypothetical protein
MMEKNSSSALAAAVGFLAMEGGKDARLDVGEGGGKALLLVDKAKFGFNASRAPKGLKETVGGQVEEDLGV